MTERTFKALIGVVSSFKAIRHRSKVSLLELKIAGWEVSINLNSHWAADG